MSRTYRTLSVLLLVFTLVLTACGGPAAPTTAPTTAAKSDTTKAEPTKAPAAAEATKAPAAAEATKAPAAAATVAPAANKEKVVLEYWDMAWGDALIAGVKAQIDEYMKQNPNVQVNFTQLNWGDYTQKFQGAVAAGTPPDVSGGSGGMPYVFWPQGALLSLDDLVTQWKANGRWADLSDWGQQKWAYQGKQIATTWQIDARGLFYRKDLFEKAGIAEPTNHDELYAAAKKLTDKSKEQFGLCFPGKQGSYDTDQWFMTLVVQNGGYQSDKEGKPAFNSPEWLSALEFEKKLLADVAPEGVPSYSFTEIERLYQQGKCAMIFEGGWFIGNLKKNAPDMYKVTGLMKPLKGTGPNAGQRMIGFYNPWMIWKDTKHPKEAMDFLNFMSDPKTLAKIYGADIGNKYGPYKSMKTDPAWQQEPMAGQLNDYVANYAVDYAWPYNSNPTGGSTLGMIISDKIVNPVLAGARQPKDVLDEAQKVAEPAYAKALGK